LQTEQVKMLLLNPYWTK